MSTDSPSTPPVPDLPPPPPAPMKAEPHSLITQAGDGADDVTVRLSWTQAQSLASSILSARRGRDDAAYLVSLGRGDYSADDIARMRSWQEREIAVEQDVIEQILAQQDRRASAGAPGEGARLIGMIEWPSDSGTYPDLLFGAGSPEDLDRMFVARLRQMIGTPGGEGGRCTDELDLFVLANGWPLPDAGDEQVLSWLRDMREALISTCCSIWQAPAGRGLAVEAHPERYSA